MHDDTLALRFLALTVQFPHLVSASPSLGADGRSRWMALQSSRFPRAWGHVLCRSSGVCHWATRDAVRAAAVSEGLLSHCAPCSEPRSAPSGGPGRIQMLFEQERRLL